MSQLLERLERQICEDAKQAQTVNDFKALREAWLKLNRSLQAYLTTPEEKKELDTLFKQMNLTIDRLSGLTD